MLKNIRIGVKLIVVGTLIMLLPLLVVAVMSITRSTKGLSAVENEQLVGKSGDIAQMIDRVFGVEKKLALTLSLDPDIAAAARAVSEKTSAAPEPAAAGKPVAEKKASGKAAPAPVADSGGGASDSVDRASAKMNRLVQTKGLGED